MPAFLTESMGTVSNLYFFLLLCVLGSSGLLAQTTDSDFVKISNNVENPKTRMINEFGMQCSVLAYLVCTLGSAQVTLPATEDVFSRGGCSAEEV